MVARLAGEQGAGDGFASIQAVDAPKRTPATVILPGGVQCVVHRTKGGFTALRRWLTAEGADVLCVKADRRGWCAVMDAAHMAALLAADLTEGIDLRFG